jgi:hypothetical protein
MSCWAAPDYTFYPSDNGADWTNTQAGSTSPVWTRQMVDTYYSAGGGTVYYTQRCAATDVGDDGALATHVLDGSAAWLELCPLYCDVRTFAAYDGSQSYNYNAPGPASQLSTRVYYATQLALSMDPVGGSQVADVPRPSPGVSPSPVALPVAGWSDLPLWDGQWMSAMAQYRTPIAEGWALSQEQGGYTSLLYLMYYWVSGGVWPPPNPMAESVPTWPGLFGSYFGPGMTYDGSTWYPGPGNQVYIGGARGPTIWDVLGWVPISSVGVPVVSLPSPTPFPTPTP